MTYGLFGVILLGLDQGTKWLAKNFLEVPITLFPGVSFRYAENTGAAFSWPIPIWMSIGLGLVVAVWIIYWTQKTYRKEKQKSLLFFWQIVFLAGVIGNLLDRVFFGAVSDFISLSSFPIFNLADIYITAGILGWLQVESRKRNRC